MILARLRAAFASLLLVATPLSAQAPAPAPTPAHPALWKVENDGTTIWLFGTIHALPAGYKWRDPALDAAFSSAQELIIEAKLEQDPAKAMALFMKLAVPPTPLPPLAERIGAQYRPELATMEAKAGAPPAVFDRMETWAAAFMLFGVSMGDLGVTANDGVEQVLKTEFTAAHKPIDAFETGEQQLSMFDTLPEIEQRHFLESVLDKPEDDKREFADMLAAWGKGDENAIAASFDTEFKTSPMLREVLLARRNATWADAIAKRLGQSGSALVAVGAGHLSGPQSVVHLLEAKGFKVTRVE